MTGLYIVAAALLLALAFGGYRHLTDGRVRGPRPARTANPDAAPLDAGGLDAARLDAGRLGADLGSTATFVQFSTSVCAPCRATHRLLSEFTATAATGAGPRAVAHVDIDAESRLDLVQEFRVTRTPTVLVLDSTGAVRHRIVGAPRKPDVEDALRQLAA